MGDSRSALTVAAMPRRLHPFPHAQSFYGALLDYAGCVQWGCRHWHRTQEAAERCAAKEVRAREKFKP